MNKKIVMTDKLAIKLAKKLAKEAVWLTSIDQREQAWQLAFEVILVNFGLLTIGYRGDHPRRARSK